MNSDEVVVSWLLPVRDGGRWLREAVDSMLAEKAPQDEVLVVDDGSVDPVASWLPPAAGLRVLRQEPGGIVSALERGRKAARGSLLARVDADDVVVAGRRQAQVEWLARHPRAGGVGGRAQMVDESGCPVQGGMARYVHWVNSVTNHRAAILIESPVFHPAMMIRAEVVAKLGGYRDGDFPEDYDLWLRMVGAGYALGAVATPVIRLRDHGRRLTRTDARYHRRAFLRLKLEWAGTHLFREGLRVAVWGAGRAGRPWLRAVVAQGCRLVAVYDLKPGGVRQGVGVQAWPDVERGCFDLLLVCVGVAAARAKIRAALGELRPDLVEGKDWWAVT